MSDEQVEARSFLKLRHDVESSAIRLGEMASKLSDHIARFEGWLNNLSGKTEATVWADHPSDSQREMGLRVHRADKRWLIAYAFQWKSGCEPLAVTLSSVARTITGTSHPDWEPLQGASIETKMAAVALFESLLREVAVSQSQLLKRLEESITKVEALPQCSPTVQKKGA